ncbi:MAG: hypothetical protein AAB198_05405 [Actinomycetota bacterium]
MPRATTSPSDLLRRASEANIESTERKLLTAAAFSEAALEHAVLVGGTAVELHTGSYRPTDIDLVGYSRSGSDAILVELGFVRDGRHWLFTFRDGETLAVEVPSDRLDDYALEAPRVIDLAPGQLAVISLNDLMMDRLLQATGGEPITMDEAVRLATAAYERLDWGNLSGRSDAAAQDGTLAGAELPAVLASVRRAARKQLRH